MLGATNSKPIQIIVFVIFVGIYSQMNSQVLGNTYELQFLLTKASNVPKSIRGYSKTKE